MSINAMIRSGAKQGSRFARQGQFPARISQAVITLGHKVICRCLRLLLWPRSCCFLSTLSSHYERIARGLVCVARFGCV